MLRVATCEKGVLWFCWGSQSTTYGLGEEGFLALHGYTSLSLKFLSRIRMVGWFKARKKGNGAVTRERECVFCIGWLVVLGIGNV